jgi:[protein-PII] uridylyltransferase
MTLHTKNQKGLMASVIEVFDDMGIDITTAKISTVKNIARDLFLIEKSAHFCDNYKKIVTQLTK